MSAWSKIWKCVVYLTPALTIKCRGDHLWRTVDRSLLMGALLRAWLRLRHGDFGDAHPLLYQNWIWLIDWLIRCMGSMEAMSHLTQISNWVCEWDKAYSLSYPLYNMWGCVFSVHPFPLWWLGEYIYICCLIIIIKLEVWTINHCLGLGHETMVCAVCLSIFLSTNITTIQQVQGRNEGKR